MMEVMLLEIWNLLFKPINISSVSHPEYANGISSYGKWIFPENFSLVKGCGTRQCKKRFYK